MDRRMPAGVLNIRGFFAGGGGQPLPHTHGIEYGIKREGSTYRSFSAMLHGRGRSWFRGSWDKKKPRGNERPELDRRQRATKMSGEKAGVTSALRLHCAINAYSSLKRDVPGLAADVMALKELDAHSFAQRISVAVECR